MKYEKIISITLVNSFVLLIFASVLASCNENKVSKTGYFTNLNKVPSRAIAGVGKIQNIKQDPKQIYIYCSLKTVKVKACYEQKITKLKINPLERTEFKFQNVLSEMDKINKILNEKLIAQLDKTVKTRTQFCLNKSIKNNKSCMTKFLDRDTFTILNKFQAKNKNMNAHEYLFVKNIIKKNLRSQLKQNATKI